MDLEQFAAGQLDGLLRFARALTGDRGLAEDLVQDVLLRLHEQNIGEIDNVEGYVRRMIVNRYVSWGRKWFRVRPVLLLPQATTGSAATDVVDLRDELRARLLRLPRQQRAAVVLRYYLDLPVEQIAAELGCSVSTVRSHLSRALAALRMDPADTANADHRRRDGTHETV
jgi:RNA polymerase sigma-70 factor (sigma-E family)